MKYYIEIWQHNAIVDVYQNNNLEDILEWYKNKWDSMYENGGCWFSVYENNRELSFDEKYELGFI